MGERPSEAELVGEKLTEVELEVIRRAAWAIMRLIPWEGSKKGGDYWQGVYQELIRISETGEP